MARKLVIALVVLAVLGGGAVFVLRKLLVATPPAPPEVARVADPTSQRTLPGGGEVVGYTGRYGSHVWLGIPYAEPPVGERRWRAPAPPAAWSGTREALAFGAHCPQLASAFGGVDDVPAGAVSGSEDCLYLNVYAPRMQPAARRAGAAAGAGVDPRRRQRGRARGFLRRRAPGAEPGSHRRDAQLPAGSPRLVPPRGAARRRVAGRAIGQLRDARSRARARVGARQRGRLRRRSGKRHDLRRVGGRPERLHAAALAAREAASSSAPSSQSGGTEHDAAGRGRELPRRHASRATRTRRTRCWRGSSSRRARRAMRARRGRRSRRCRAAQIAGFLRGATPEQLFAAYGRDADEGLIDVPQVFADGVVLPTGDALAAVREARRLEPRARDRGHQPRREQALHVHGSALREALVRRVSAGPRSRALSGDGRRAQRPVEGDRRRRPGVRDLDDAAERLRLPLRLGRRAERCSASTSAASSAPRTASRSPSCSATGISARRAT